MKLRVLLIDHVGQNGRILRDFFIRCGLDVYEEDFCLEACRTAEKVRPDLILMDISAPTMAGIAALSTIRNSPLVAGTPVIGLTSLASKETVIQFMGLGLSDLLVKPIRLSEAYTVIHRYFPETTPARTAA